MNIQHIAAFSCGLTGGNPAGVVLLDIPASETQMAQVAAEVGYSETVFAVRLDDDGSTWRARYFSPESEVPFCGHATIALGAVLAEQFGSDTYQIEINDASISVSSENKGDLLVATLASPPTRSVKLKAGELKGVLKLFGLTSNDLNERLPPALIHAGANHLMIALKERSQLALMNYDLDKGRSLMRDADVATIMLVYVDNKSQFEVRNAFASGGVFEDPATGAAAAAFAGYLRDEGWPHGGNFSIRQGYDMGQPCLINVSLSNELGSSVLVSGSARHLERASLPLGTK